MTVWNDIHPDEMGRGDSSVPVRLSAFGKDPGDGSDSGLDLSFFVSLGASLGSLADSMKRTQDRRDRRAGLAPQDHQVSRDKTLPSTGKGLIDLGSVPVGRVWQIRRIVIGGVTATADPAGKAFVIAQGAPPSTTAPLTDNVVDSFPSFKTGCQGATYGTHQLFLTSPEHLWVVILGGATGVQWTASARIEDYDAETYYSTYNDVTE